MAVNAAPFMRDFSFCFLSGGVGSQRCISLPETELFFNDAYSSGFIVCRSPVFGATKREEKLHCS